MIRGVNEILGQSHIHSPDQIHQINEHIHVHQNVLAHRVAADVGNFTQELVHAVRGVHAVDLTIVVVKISRNADHGHGTDTFLDTFQSGFF